MASTKIRRLLRPTGGITLGNATFGTTGNLSTTGTAQIGTYGTAVSKITVGSFAATATSVGAASSGSIVQTVAGLAVTDRVFVTPGSLAACMVFAGASVQSASLLEVLFYNTGSAATADAALSFHYVIFA